MLRCDRVVTFRLVCLGHCASALLAANVCHPRKAQRTTGSTVCRFNILIIQVFAVTKLYVGNLSFTATDESVRALFSQHGTVEKVSLISDRDTGQPRGFGFVEMSNSDATRAMQALNGTEFDGRSLKVNEAQDRERSGGNRGGPRRY